MRVHVRVVQQKVDIFKKKAQPPSALQLNKQLMIRSHCGKDFTQKSRAVSSSGRETLHIVFLIKPLTIPYVQGRLFGGGGGLLVGGGFTKEGKRKPRENPAETEKSSGCDKETWRAVNQI